MARVLLPVTALRVRNMPRSALGLGSICHVQISIHIQRVPTHNQGQHTGPAKRTQSGSHVIVAADAGHQPSSKVNDFLQPVQMTAK